MNILSILFCAAEIVLPCGEVNSIPVFQDRMYPARVVAIQKVDVVPQVSGEILEVAFENGAIVKEGDVLCVLEAMKMENEIMAPKDGTVTQVLTSKGSSVDTGAVLVIIG